MTGAALLVGNRQLTDVGQWATEGPRETGQREGLSEGLYREIYKMQGDNICALFGAFYLQLLALMLQLFTTKSICSAVSDCL